MFHFNIVSKQINNANGTNGNRFGFKLEHIMFVAQCSMLILVLYFVSVIIGNIIIVFTKQHVH